MTIRAAGLGLAVAALLCAGCGKSPQEIEAERARAQREWNEAADRAEQARRAEVQRLVEQQLTEHHEQATAEDERARRERTAAQAAEMESRLDRVRSALPNARSAIFRLVHWNADASTLCGRVSFRIEGAPKPEDHAFVVTDDRVVIDTEDEAGHQDFSAVADATGCAQAPSP